MIHNCFLENFNIITKLTCLIHLFFCFEMFLDMYVVLIYYYIIIFYYYCLDEKRINKNYQ